jgi:hypothetical protein
VKKGNTKYPRLSHTSIPDPDADYAQMLYKEQQATWFQDTIQCLLVPRKIAFAYHPYISFDVHGIVGMYDSIPLYGSFIKIL